jgi:predicted lipid-binding transport protein (Tim44 family)
MNVAMEDTFDITTLLFLVAAVVIGLWLRSVLGRRTGHEKPRYDPVSPARNGAAPDNVVTMPLAAARPLNESEPAPTPEERLGKYANRSADLAGGLMEIARADGNFEPSKFLDGAKAAYETIVTAFAQGNRKLLKQLLSREVYDGFEMAISQRERSGETVEFSFIGISKADLERAGLAGRMAQVSVKFVSELITSTHDRNGTLMDGDPKKIREVNDIWTFARDVTSRDPNWKLIATETGA